MQQLTEIEIDKIKPDPNQPRTTIEELDVREMSQSIITEGVINAIEVDKDYVIITGEMRWRAAKMAGLKKVPIKIIDSIGKGERLMRQVIENIHNHTMTDLDLGKSFRNLIDTDFTPTKVQGQGRPQTGNEWLAEKIGKGEGFVREKLSLIKQSKEMQEAIKSKSVASSFVRAIKKTPEQFKETVEEKILNNEFKTYHIAVDFANALKKEEKNPEVVKKLLETDFSEFKNEEEFKKAISEIIPEKVKEEKNIPSEKINKITEDLKEWVRSNPKSIIKPEYAPRITVNMNFIKALVEEWFYEEGGN